jgi:hypothetical protein
MKKNELFILMDDSGKLNINENSCIYGGLFFYNSFDYMNFINKYKSIIKKIKCKYCKQCNNNCNKKCIEIKGTSKISNEEKRWIFNLVKKENNYGVFIKNKNIYNFIMKDKASRGRYIDYAQKRIIKEIIMYSLSNNLIDANKPLKLYIKLDECSTKSNGYYNLKNSIYEELVNGIINYNYSIVHDPIIKNSLEVIVNIYNSKYNYGIQSADMMAHYLHSCYEEFLIFNRDITNLISFIEVKLFLP